MTTRWEIATQLTDEPSSFPGSGPIHRSLTLELVKLWRQGEPVDVFTLLSRHPELKPDKTVLIDLAFEEYRLRGQAGQEVDPDAFCERFPSFKASLRRMIEDHRRLGQTTAPSSDIDAQAVANLGPTLFGFTLMRELGRGAFARVYLAREPALGNRRVVLKVSGRGGAEAETLGRLSHPHIVPVHSVHEHQDSGVTVVCMPYLGNATLCDVLDRVQVEPALPTKATAILDAIRDKGAPYEPPPSATPARLLVRGSYIDGIVHLGAQLADGLAHIHAEGIYHRDLKPSNVLLTPDGRPMLLDFNLSFDEQIAENRLGGTLPYMSPEQLEMVESGKRRDPARVAGPSDVFSLGVILFELLAGTHPFGMLPLRLSWHHMRRNLLDRHREGCMTLRRLNPAVDPELARVVERCLAFEPAARPKSAAELAKNLSRSLGWPRRLRRWLRSHPKLACALFSGVLAVSFAAAWIIARQDPYPLRELKRGREEFRRGDYSQALSHFTRSLDADRKAETLFARGRTYLKLSDLHAAFGDFSEAYRLTPQGTTKAALGYCLSMEGRHSDAVVHYRQALEGGFAPAEVYNDLGFSLLERKIDVCRHEAEAALDKAIQLAPRLQAAYHNRARAEIARSKQEEWFIPSAGEMQTAIELGPASRELWADAASVHWLIAQRTMVRFDRVRHVQITLDCLRKAVEEGEDPVSLGKSVFYKDLRGEAGFQDLVKLPASLKPPSKAQRLLDPFPSEE